MIFGGDIADRSSQILAVGCLLKFTMFFLLDTAEDSNRRMLNVLRPERKRLRVHVRDGNWCVR